MAASMPLVLVQFDEAVAAPDGRSFVARACGRVMDDGTGRWEGWLEFDPEDGGKPVRTGQETTQPSVTHVRYWATGLTRAYLDGALRRVLAPPPPDLRTDRRVDAAAAYEGPSPHRAGTRTGGARRARQRAVLDPFAVYAQGESVLRQELSALDAGHLRSIIDAYGLAAQSDVRMMGEPALAELIVRRVRGDERAGGNDEGPGPRA